MDERVLNEILEDILINLDNEYHIHHDLIKKLVSLSYAKQYDANRDSLVSGVKELLSRNGFELR